MVIFTKSTLMTLKILKEGSRLQVIQIPFFEQIVTENPIHQLFADFSESPALFDRITGYVGSF